MLAGCRTRKEDKHIKLEEKWKLEELKKKSNNFAIVVLLC
jgi:hypothetical protein